MDIRGSQKMLSDMSVAIEALRPSRQVKPSLHSCDYRFLPMEFNVAQSVDYIYLSYIELKQLL